METSTNQSFLAWPYRLCPGVSTAVPRLLVGCGGVGNAPGRGLCGLCLAHCWVLRQQDLFAAMQRASSGVSFVPASGIAGHCRQPRSFLGVWVVVSGGLVDGVVV